MTRSWCEISGRDQVGGVVASLTCKARRDWSDGGSFLDSYQSASLHAIIRYEVKAFLTCYLGLVPNGLSGPCRNVESPSQGNQGPEEAYKALIWSFEVVKANMYECMQRGWGIVGGLVKKERFQDTRSIRERRLCDRSAGHEKHEK